MWNLKCAGSSQRNVISRHASSILAEEEIETSTVGTGSLISMNILQSLKCTVIPDAWLCSDSSLPLLVLSILSKTKKLWTWEVLLFFGYFYPNENFSMNAGMHDLQLLLSFCEATSTWRNDVTCKNLLNRPIFSEINKWSLCTCRVLCIA